MYLGSMPHCVSSSNRQIAESTGYTCTLIYICMMYVSTFLEAYVDARSGLSVADRVTVLLEAIQADFCRGGSFTQNRSHTIHTDKPCHHTHPGHDCDASRKRLTRLRACLLAFLVRVVNVNLISCGRCSVATLFSTWPLFASSVAL